MKIKNKNITTLYLRLISQRL